MNSPSNNITFGTNKTLNYSKFWIFFTDLLDALEELDKRTFAQNLIVETGKKLKELERNKKFLIKDLHTGETLVWTTQEILHEINWGHSDEYTPYHELDWKEGWNEWVEWNEYYSFIREQQ